MILLSEIKTIYIPELEKQILFHEIYIKEYLDGDIVCYLKDVRISGEVLERLKHLSNFNINIYGFTMIDRKVKLREKEVLEGCKLVEVEKKYCLDDSYVNLDFTVSSITESTSISEWEYGLQNILKI